MSNSTLPKVVLLIFIFIAHSFSQSNKDYYYLGFNFGNTFIDDSFANKHTANFGISVSKESWPHLFRFSLQNNGEIVSSGTPRFPSGFESKIIELNLIYDYLLKIPKLNTVFFGVGSGIGLMHIKQDPGYNLKERTKKEFTKPGIPIEIKIGFLYPNKKFRLLDFVYFFNINSFENFNGWKINFNIGIN